MCVCVCHGLSQGIIELFKNKELVFVAWVSQQAAPIHTHTRGVHRARKPSLGAMAVWNGAVSTGCACAPAGAVRTGYGGPRAPCAAVLAAQVHFIVFDLWCGRWIALDAVQRRVPRILVAPCLFCTLMAGPIGLGLYLIIRTPFSAPRGARAKHE